MSKPSPKTPPLYESDFYSWTKTQAELLRRGDAAAADLQNIAEELESLGKSQESALASSYRVLLTHLLKYKFQPNKISQSWRLSIANQRDDIADLIEDNPGLKPKRESLFAKAYKRARRDCAIETGLPISTFPETNPFSLGQAQDSNFWPIPSNPEQTQKEGPSR